MAADTDASEASDNTKTGKEIHSMGENLVDRGSEEMLNLEDLIAEILEKGRKIRVFNIGVPSREDEVQKGVLKDLNMIVPGGEVQRTDRTY